MLGSDPLPFTFALKRGVRPSPSNPPWVRACKLTELKPEVFILGQAIDQKARRDGTEARGNEEREKREGEREQRGDRERDKKTI